MSTNYLEKEMTKTQIFICLLVTVFSILCIVKLLENRREYSKDIFIEHRYIIIED